MSVGSDMSKVAVNIHVGYPTAPDKCHINHEIHTSERRSFRGCRRRWSWIFHDKYYPIVTAKPLEFGVAYHQAMEVFYEPSTWHMDREVVGLLAIEAFVEKCHSQLAEYLKNREDPSLDEEVKDDYAERVQLGKNMLKYYFTKVSPKLDHFKPVKVEVAFRVPILDPSGNPLLCPACGAPITYGGRVDCLVEDEHGDYWIVDWKTAASITDRTEHLALDDQVGSYPWAFRQMKIPVRGFIYHEQKKAFPEPPKENSTVRLGRKYSVNKNAAVEYDSYLQAVYENDRDAYDQGLYDEYLQYLKIDGPKFYARYQIHKSNEELRQIGLNLYYEACDMTDPQLRIYPSAGRFSCSFCAFRQPCLGKNAGEDYEYTLNSLYIKRDRHYWEEKELSTETQGGE